MYRLRNDTLIPVVAYLRTGAMRTTSDVRHRLPYSVVIDIIRLVVLVCTPNRPFHGPYGRCKYFVFTSCMYMITFKGAKEVN